MPVFILSDHDAKEQANHAGPKAKRDAEKIVTQMGARIEKQETNPVLANSAFERVLLSLSNYHSFSRVMRRFKKHDVVILQYPNYCTGSFLFPRSIETARRKGVKVITIVHDLESFRSPAGKGASFNSDKNKEANWLKASDCLIVHNAKMIAAIQEKYEMPQMPMASLGIFDYLTDSDLKKADTVEKGGPIVIAGNLSPFKAGYLYEQDFPLETNLYGIGYENVNNTLHHYQGAYSPEELPSILEGSFGLVWDGVSCASCTGDMGDYLRINNPHKASLYISAGLPLIVWSKSALAEFVKKNNIGLCVDSLFDVPQIIRDLGEEEYAVLKKNVSGLKEKVAAGSFLKSALTTAGRILECEELCHLNVGQR